MDLFNRKLDLARPDISKHLPDLWVATSALQKSIRRGAMLPALAATSLLLERNGDRFWRRLVVIALEDIGIGDLETVRRVMLAATRKTWRAENGGDWAVASELVQSLCLAPKSRDACELLVIADLHPRLKRLRGTYLDLSAHQLSDILANPENGLAERTLAAWLIAGTRRFPAYSLPEVEGSFPALLDIYRHIGVPEYVLEVARLGSTRTQEGHPFTLPLVWLAASTGPLTVDQPDLPEPVLIQGWPDYAFDMHCRLGKQALFLFSEQNMPLRQLMHRLLPLNAHADLVGHLVFRIEGHIVDRRLRYPGAGAILHDAEIAHLTYSGLPENLFKDLLAAFGDNLELLHQCRIDAVRGRA